MKKKIKCYYLDCSYFIHLVNCVYLLYKLLSHMNVEMLFQNFFHAELISGQEILNTWFWPEFRLN